MDSSSIKETIKRLKALEKKPDNYWHDNVTDAFMGKTAPSAYELLQALVDMLSQCDPDEWSKEFLADNGLMRLPKDADGQYVHVDDDMVDSCGGVFTVNGIGGNTLYYYDEVTDTVEWTRSTNKRHHRPDTFERIIEDALRNGTYYSECDVRRLVERCEALAGGVQ